MDGPFPHWPILSPSPGNWREPTAKRTQRISPGGVHPGSSLDPEMKPGRKGLTWAYLPWERCQECAPCYSPVLASSVSVSSPTALAPFSSNLLQILCLFVTLPYSFSLSLSTGSAPQLIPMAVFLCKHSSLKSHYPFTCISFILLQNVLKELNSLSLFHPNSYVDTLIKKALNITNTPTFIVCPIPNSLPRHPSLYPHSGFWDLQNLFAQILW